MKALVISDSHGFAVKVMKAVEKTMPDVIIHLGDGVKDLRGIGLLYPNIELYDVSGNCDFDRQRSAVRIIEDQGIRIFMTHGHVYNVKYGLEYLISTARNNNADIVMYGHTHSAHFEERDDITVINPGSLGFSGSYGVLTIENGKTAYEKCVLL